MGVGSERVVPRPATLRAMAERSRGARGAREVWLARLLVVTFVAGGLAFGVAALQAPSKQQVLDAIRFVESSGRDDCPDGDGGKAIGPFQIHEVYWTDAVAFAPELGPKAGHGYQDCRRRDYAERVVDAYMRRYVPVSWWWRDAEVIARVHNGGPKGYRKTATEKYWEKVERRLASGR